MLSLADLAVTYALQTELLRSTISSRMGSIIQGQLEGGLLYTPAYVRNIKAQLRGALRGTAAPVALTALVKSIGLEGFSSGHSKLAQLVEELISEGAVQGSTKGGGGSWVPTVHTTAQQSAVAGFYNQNGWVAYDLVRKAGISNEKSYLSQKFPEGISLDTGKQLQRCCMLDYSTAAAVLLRAQYTPLFPAYPSAQHAPYALHCVAHALTVCTLAC